MLGFAVLALPACTVGGNFKRPALKVDAAWLERPAGVAMPPRSDWWRAFNDPVLDALILKAVQNSPDLRTAAAKVAQARAQARISSAERKPEIGLSGSLDGFRIPPEIAERLDGIDPVILRDSLDLQGSWEIDFWGKALSAARADRADLLASRAAYDAAMVSLLGSLATSYVDLRVLQARAALAEAVASRQLEAAQQARIRFREGDTSRQPLDQAIVTAAQARAQADAFIAEIARERHESALLAGITDTEILPLVAVPRVIPTPPPPPDAGIPRDLLRNRPDVMQAEASAMAQFQRLKSAKAGLYPSFSLSGALGLSATNVGSSSLLDIFDWSKRSVSGGLSFLVPVFDRGRLLGQVRVQDAVVQQALIAYEKAVLVAQRDVGDALAQAASIRQSMIALRRAADASSASVQIAEARYREGAADRLSFVNAQAADLGVQDALIEAKGQSALSFIALNRALGLGAVATPEVAMSQGTQAPRSDEASR